MLFGANSGMVLSVIDYPVKHRSTYCPGLMTQGTHIVALWNNLPQPYSRIGEHYS